MPFGPLRRWTRPPAGSDTFDRRRHGVPRSGSVCRTTRDPRQLPAGINLTAAERLLRTAPGVLGVRL